MPPRMMTRSVGRSTTAPRGGRTGGQTGRGSGRTRGQKQTGRGGGRDNRTNRGVDEAPDFPTVIVQQLQYLLPTIVAQVGDHIRNQGINRIQNDNADDDNIYKDVRNVNVSNDR
ncbi:hypothetical protein Tco_0342291, partial [Tanacetum coccineum]